LTDERAATPHILTVPALRRFGFTLGGALLVISGLRWWWTGARPLVLPLIAVTAVLLAAAAPQALRPLRRLTVLLGQWAQRGVTAAAMFAAFWLVITPAGLIMRLAAKDPMNRAWQPEADTYWDEPEDQPEELERYRHPF
jgi:hypothetical protein